jgi:hypothetical protein
VRLGRKYAFADFAEASLKHLQTVLYYIQVDRSVTKIKGFTPASLYKLATVAEELGIQVLLPALYFSAISSLTLVRIRFQTPFMPRLLVILTFLFGSLQLEISDGLSLEGGSTLTFPPHFRQMVLRHHDGVARALRAMCRWLLDPTAPLAIPTADCITRAECGAALEQKRRILIRDVILAHLETLHEFPGMCAKCLSQARMMVFSQFSQFYNANLLSIFELRSPLATFTN